MVLLNCCWHLFRTPFFIFQLRITQCSYISGIAIENCTEFYHGICSLGISSLRWCLRRRHLFGKFARRRRTGIHLLRDSIFSALSHHLKLRSFHHIGRTMVLFFWSYFLLINCWIIFIMSLSWNYQMSLMSYLFLLT